MAKIKTYTSDTSLAGTEKFIGSDTDGTTLNYTIPNYADISIDIYNLNGQLVENLCKGYKNPGEYSISWNASNVTSGVYFI